MTVTPKTPKTKKEKPYKYDILFSAQVYQVKTLVDGGVNVTLSVDSRNMEAITKLFHVKQTMALLEIAAIAIEPEKPAKVDKPAEKPKPKIRDLRHK